MVLKNKGGDGGVVAVTEVVVEMVEGQGAPLSPPPPLSPPYQTAMARCETSIDPEFTLWSPGPRAHLWGPRESDTRGHGG